MNYKFLHLQEAFWVAVVAAGTFGIELLVRFDADTVTDWKAWAISGASGLVRAVAAGLIAWRATRGR